MTIMLDRELQAAELTTDATLGDALDWAQRRLAGSGKIIVSVKLDGQTIEGPQLDAHHAAAIGTRHVELDTESQDDLARRTLGKLAALVEFLAPRHQKIAALLEQRQRQPALAELGEVLTAWQHIEQAFGGLCTMLKIPLNKLMVSDRPAELLVGDFVSQLQEIQNALQSQDMVLLADIMQYEMDGAISNWLNLLATVLGVVDGVVEV